MRSFHTPRGAPALTCGALVALASAATAGGCKKSQASTTAEGSALFASLCSRCHGAEGTGGLPVSDGGPAPRNFHDHAFQAARSDDDIRRTIKEGRGASGMPPFAGVLNDGQIDALIIQVRSFDPERGK